MGSQDQISQMKTGLLFLNHSGTNPAAFNFLAAEIQRTGLAVRCPQPADHGTFLAESIRYRSCERALAEIARNFDRVIVVGLGLGGLIGLRLAAENPHNVHGVIALSPALWLKIPAVQKLLPAFCINALISMRIQLGSCLARLERAMGKADTDEPMSASAHSTKEHRRFALELIKKLKSVHQPTLIVQSRTNKADLRCAEFLQRHLGGLVHVSILDRRCHDGAVDCRADAVAEKLLAFVAAVEKPPTLAEDL